MGHVSLDSDRDRVPYGHIRLDCFPSLRTINMYLMLFVRKERHHVSQITTLGAPPPLSLGFHPSKRQHYSCLYLGITRTEAFFMASNASYPDVSQHVLVDSLCAYLFIICEHHDISVRSCSNLMLILIT